jgi:hypothetical protein
MAPPNHITKTGQEPNVGSLAASLGLRRLILAAIVGSNVTLFVSPQLTVCGPLHIDGRAAVEVGRARPVGHEAASLRIRPYIVHGRQTAPDCEIGEPSAVLKDQGVSPRHNFRYTYNAWCELLS